MPSERRVGHAVHALPFTSAFADTFERHRPEETVLYQTVAVHWDSFVEHAEQQGGLPKFVLREVKDCGLLERGCALLQCAECGKTASTYSYWDGRIIKAGDGKFHMFASRWNQSTGHNGWFGSSCVHAVSDSNVLGPYMDKGLCYSDANGQGHNVMASQLKDGRYFIVVSETRRPAVIYTSMSLDGPWRKEGTITTDANGYSVDASSGGNLHSNTTMWVRDDGSILATSRDGVIMLSTTGILGPYKVQGTSVYANISYTPGGTPEDPVLWYSGCQYHMVYSYPLDRKSYHLTSSDGIKGWVNAGLATDATKPFIKYTDGTANVWNKLERPQVYLENGHVKYFSFAAIDVDKGQDVANDKHDSKVIVVPFDGERFDQETGRCPTGAGGAGDSGAGAGGAGAAGMSGGGADGRGGTGAGAAGGGDGTGGADGGPGNVGGSGRIGGGTARGGSGTAGSKGTAAGGGTGGTAGSDSAGNGSALRGADDGGAPVASGKSAGCACAAAGSAGAHSDGRFAMLGLSVVFVAHRRRRGRAIAVNPQERAMKRVWPMCWSVLIDCMLILTAACGSDATGSGGQGGTGAGAAGAAGSSAQASGETAGTAGTGGTGGASATGSGGGSAGGGRGGSAGTDGGAGTGGAVASGTIFVAPSGDDANPGTMAQPLKTVAKARDLVREMTASVTADVTVYLRGGTYPQNSTLTFGNADSGKNGFYVKYFAYQKEQPIITGGKPITGWTMSSVGNGIYSASGVTTPFRQLYVDGVKAIRARNPNLGANGAFAFNRLTGADNTAQNIQVAASEAASWNNLTKVEMHVMTGWGDNTLRLASVTTSGGTANVKIQSPESTLVFVRPFPHLGGQFGGFTKHVYYFENALEFLDQPGEWYLDETNNLLYYKPRSGEDMTRATVVAPLLETVMSVEGTSTSDQAGYLWFQGITFAHSTFMRPSLSGFCDAQAGQYNLTATSDNKQTIGRPPAGVSVMNANHVHFERNIVMHMGATGLDFVSGTHDDIIIGNVVTDIAGNGISIGKFAASEMTEYHLPYNPTDKNEICTNDAIKNNYIHHVTTEFQGGTGIAAGYPKQIDIDHNEVAYTNYTAISVGYGWTSSVNAMSSNKIDNNDIHHAVQVLADGAGIYTLSNQQPNSQMQYNYLHDYQTSQWADYASQGIYLDEQTSGYTIAHNAMVNAPANVAQNRTGQNTITDTPATDPQSVGSVAGIEAAYADIKTLPIPVPSF